MIDLNTVVNTSTYYNNTNLRFYVNQMTVQDTI
jgi:hypothetical protein